MSLKDNTAGLRALISKLDDLPVDRYTEGYDKGYDEGYGTGYDKGYGEGASGLEPEEVEGLIPTDRDIIFIDYDGTELYTYSIEEARNLFAMPPLPQHEGLITTGWNWTLEELQQNNRPAVIGPLFMTDDERTRVYLSVEKGFEGANIAVYVAQQKENGVIILWGDGTSTPASDISAKYYEHSYKNPGEYVISFQRVFEDNDYYLCQ